MRISLVIHTLGAGGAEKVIITIANEWARRGHEVSLISFGEKLPYFSLDARVQLHLLRMPNLHGASVRTFRVLLQRVLALRRTIRRERSDIVISFLTKINVISTLATLGLKTSLVLSERNNPERQEFNGVWRFFRDTSYRMCDRIVVMTRGAKNHLSELKGDRVRVIPNPVDSNNDLKRPGSGTKNLIAVGRLVEQKGFDLLLKAFAQIADKHPDRNLIIFGEGHKRQELTNLRDQLDLRNRVSLPGITNAPGEWTIKGEVFVLSSRFEGFGNVLCEAMGAGLAVVSFDCPWGPSEIIQHEEDGLIVPAENVEKLAAAIDRVLVDPQLRSRLGSAAKKSVARFSLEAVITKWDGLLEELTIENEAR